MSIASYLTTVTPDYATTTFSVNPHGVISVPGSYKQSVFEPDGGDVYTVTIDSNAKFFFNLSWNRISTADFNTIIGFYFDTGKAYGLSRSFKWQHPIESQIYVVKFATPLTYTERFVAQKGINEITLRVIGKSS